MNSLFNSIKPHLLVVLIGLLAIFSYFPSVFLESKTIDMGDIKRSLSTSKQHRDFRDNTGIEPLWTNSQFGGMPTYQMNTKYPNNLISHLEKYTKLGLPSSLGLLFMMFIGFYFLSISLGNKVWISAIGGFAFAFSTFFIISLEAGHTGKLRAIGYMAPVLIGVIMTMKGRLFLGGALTSFFLAFAINANHFQITYYLSLMIMIYILIEGIYHIKEKNLKPFLIKSSVLAIAALIAVGPNISRLWTTMDYSEETMRGGSSELTEHKDSKAGGLEKEYAMRWSYGKAETFTLLIPGFYGGSSTGSLSLDSKTGDALQKRGVPKKQLENYMQFLPIYWGDQPFVGGPVFLGSVIIFLFVLSLFIVKGRLKIWLITCTIFSIVLSWGSNFEVVTDLFFYYFPMYNKFRVPSMILVIASLTIPLLAMLALNKILQSPKGVMNYMPEIKKAFYITGGVSLLFALLGPSLFSFSAPNDQSLPEGWPIEDLVEDRKSILVYSAFKSFLFISLCFGLLLAYAKNKITPRYFIIGIVVSIGLDIWMADKEYLNEDSLVRSKGRDSFYVDTPADKSITQDSDPNYRVFNLTVNPFTDALTSFHHKSVGGYHGAKLIRYQDMIDHHLSKNNSKVLDMLNTKYYIVPNEETRVTEVRGNPNALGNAWFVENVIWVENADAEINQLNDFDPAMDVVIDKRYQASISNTKQLSKSNNNIKLIDYQPNKLVYETETSGSGQFAVFSEIYYEGTDHDWKVYIDGNPASHIRVNYILRGMDIPEGKHVIEFKFEPISYIQGEKWSLVFSIIVIISVLLAIILEIKTNGKETSTSGISN